ncbi:MAG: helix-turn-helix transcriptional regulator, partial [Treponema sp.]|nr:helix-turn-helix transcriptional regulator [Treponema sp.]
MKTQVFNPEQGAALERIRLNALLEKALQSRLVTVIAGEGYGKTHSVRAFLHKKDLTAVWVQLSEQDNLTGRFWENFSGVIALQNRELGAALAEMDLPETNRQFDCYRALVHQGIVPQRKYVIILDDFHLITSQPVLRFLNHTLTVPLPKVTIILISRAEPEIHTVALLSKGLLARITADDLRFSEQEITDYFKMLNLPMKTDELARIYRDTEGWVLALELIAADGKKKKKGEALYSPDLMKAMSFKRIENTFFNGMEKEMQKFLIKLSLIENWPRELLEKLAPDQKLIAGMEQINALIRYDNYLHGYRIHYLLIEFLRERQCELSAAEIREVYARTAQWCLANNLRMEAAAYFEKNRDYTQLIELIYSFPRILSHGTAAFFLEMIRRLNNRGDTAEDALLFLQYIIRPKLLLALGRYDEASAESQDAIAAFEARPGNPLNARILCVSYLIRGTIALLG